MSKKMISIKSNEMKVRGVSAIKQLLEDNTEVAITVRGKAEYVVLKMDDYARFRELELEAAIAETRNNLKDGHFTINTVQEHINELKSDN